MKLKNKLPPEIYHTLIRVYDKYFNSFKNLSYSQEGEDLILRRFFENQNRGFYVDIGAHHPKRFSNTYLFYKIGWTGLNIEARPGSKKLFDKVRPKDINLETAISSRRETLIYYEFDEPALNTFSKAEATEKVSNSKYKIIKERQIITKRLDEILENHLKNVQKIDFFSIDVEGMDYDVLISNNWDKFRPKVIVIEDSKFNLRSGTGISEYLYEIGYEFFAKTVKTCFYIDTKSKE